MTWITRNRHCDSLQCASTQRSLEAACRGESVHLKRNFYPGKWWSATFTPERSLHGTSWQVNAIFVFACLCLFAHGFAFVFEFIFACVFQCLCLFVFVSRFIFLLLLVLVDCGRKDKCDAGFCAAVTVGRACSLVHLPFAGQAGELSGELRRGDCGHGQAIKWNFRTAQHVKSR